MFTLTALTGNGLVLIGTIWKTPSLHSPSNVLLFGLALSDSVVGLIVQPLYVTCLIVEIVMKKYLDAVWTASAYRMTQAVFDRVRSSTNANSSEHRYISYYSAVVTGKRTLIALLLIWMTSVAYALTVIIADNE